MTAEKQSDDFDYYEWELKTNKYTRFYEDELEDKTRFKREAGSNVQKELRKYTHRDAIEFAAKTWDWTKNTYPSLKTQLTAKIPTYKCQEGIRAYYRVLVEKESKYILIACHANLHGYHRGDLRFVEVNNRTVLKGLDKISVIGMLFPGDVIAVTKMGKKSKVNSKPPRVCNVHLDTDCTWEVQNMTLLTRKKENRDVTFAILENGLAVVKGRGEAMNVIEDSERRPLKVDNMYSGHAFIPEKIEVDFTEDFHRKYEKPLTALTSNLPSYPNSLGTIYSYDHCEANNRLFEIGTTAFNSKTFRSHSKEADEIVELCTVMGASAVEAVMSRRFDSRGFPMHDIKQDGVILHFSIANPPNQPTENRWNTNNRICIDGEIGIVDAIIETVVLEGKRRIRIAARLPMSFKKNIKFRGIWIVHQREMPERLRLKTGFLKGVNANSNGRRVIETLYGGPAITINKTLVDDKAVFVFPSEPPVVLNEYQNLYVSMILADVPLVLGNSPFGCGKSMTIVTAAIEVHKRNSRFNNHGKHRRQQLLITQTNNAGVSLVEIARKVVNVKVKFCRYVSESNWEVLPESSRTIFDMPVLMKELFVAWATGTLDNLREYQPLTSDMKKAIVRKVVQKGLGPEKLVGEAKRLYENLSKNEKTSAPSSRILRTVFFTLYQPDIIVTTADSLNSLILGNNLNNIANLQIDEASQLPECTLIYLLQTFLHAGFGLVGDIKQLPPHCEKELVGRLKDYGIGNTLERALNNAMFPQSALRYVYRCHPIITNFLSELFYQSRLISGVEENDRNEFMRMRSDVWPNREFPILVLNHEKPGHRMGTSVANKSEMLHVIRIVRTLTRKINGYKLSECDIGVMSFYRAQTSLFIEAFRGTDVKCGTVDAFQGTEREVMIVCCTNSKPSVFMNSSNRFNVAMSRARQANIIIGNVEELRKAIYWDEIVKKASENGCLVDEIENFGDSNNPDINPTRYYNFSNDESSSNDSDDDGPDDENLFDVNGEDVNDCDRQKTNQMRRGGRRRGNRNSRGEADKQFQPDDQASKGQTVSTDVAANCRTKKRRNRRRRAKQRELEEQTEQSIELPNKRQRDARRKNGTDSSVKADKKPKNAKAAAQKSRNNEATLTPIIEKMEEFSVASAVTTNNDDESDEGLMIGRRRLIKNCPKF